MKKYPQFEELCKYCEHAEALTDQDAMLCEKMGIVSAAYRCRRFRYDPLKRDPGTPRRTAPLIITDLDDDT